MISTPEPSNEHPTMHPRESTTYVRRLAALADAAVSEKLEHHWLAAFDYDSAALFFSTNFTN